jgi:hypothetical protein
MNQRKTELEDNLFRNFLPAAEFEASHILKAGCMAKACHENVTPHLSSEEATGTHVHGPLLAVKTFHVHLERSKHTALRQYFQVFIGKRPRAMQAL